MKSKKYQVVIGVLILSWVNLFLVEKYFIQNGISVPLELISSENLDIRILNDILAMCTIPVIIIVAYRRKITMFRLSFVSLKECSILVASLLIFWVLHGDYSVRGIYKVWFYLCIIGFFEEFVFRGYAYNFLVSTNRIAAILISGSFFGVMHAISPIILGQLSLISGIIEIASNIGGGIVSGYLFIYLEEKSQTLFVPILVHAVLDYSYKLWGVFITICLCIHFFTKEKRRKSACIVK